MCVGTPDGANSPPGCPRNKQTKNLVWTETRSLSVVLWFVSWNQKQKISVCFGVLNLIKTNETNRTVLKPTETNRNNPKFSEKHQNMLPIKLFQLVFCFFRFNRNIKTLCFGIEVKQPKQMFVSDNDKTSFGFRFRLFETSLDGHTTTHVPLPHYCLP